MAMPVVYKPRLWPFVRNTGLLAAVSALAALNWHLLTTPLDVRPIEAAPASSPMTGAALEPTGPTKPPQVYRETLARPLFRPDRRPFVAAPPPPPEQETPVAVEAASVPPAPLTPPEGLKLVGVMRDGSGGGRALMRTAQSPSASWLEIGDEIEGWRVAKIGQSNVTLELEDAKVSLDLYPSAPAGDAANP